MSKTNKTKVQSPFDDFKGMNRNTDLCVDVKTFLFDDRVAQLGKGYKGILTRDDDEHFTFVEDPTTAKATQTMRNPIVYRGSCINLHRNAMGELYPTFTRPQFSVIYTLCDFLREAAEELEYVARLVEKKSVIK